MTPLFSIFAQTAQTSGTKAASVFVEGLSLGTIYALLAVGFVIIFKATRVLNFAHGALAAVGAFLVSAMAITNDIPGRWMPDAPAWVTWTGSVIIAVIAMGLLGMALERVFLRPMVGEELFAVAIVTLGLDIVIRTITNDFIGQFPRPMGDPFGFNHFDIGPFRIAYTEATQIAVALVLGALIALFFRSRTGIAMRATAFDQEAARAQGINVGRVFSLSWAIGAMLAAIAGLFVSMYPRRLAGVDQQTAFYAFKAFPAIVIGGLDSVGGAIAGGLIVGMAEAVAIGYAPVDVVGFGFPGVVPFLLMLIVLMVKPHGLFGTHEVRRV